jgi:hypothetical protein
MLKDLDYTSWKKYPDSKIRLLYFHYTTFTEYEVDTIKIVMVMSLEKIQLTPRCTLLSIPAISRQPSSLWSSFHLFGLCVRPGCQ